MSVKRSKVMHGITRKLDDAEYSLPQYRVFPKELA